MEDISIMASTKPTSSLKRMIVGVTAAGAIGIGGLTVAALNPLGDAGAQDATTTTTPVAAAPAPAAAPTTAKAAHRKVTRRVDQGILQQALKSLVDDKTLTQAQADAVTTRVKDTAKADATKVKAASLSTIAKAIGVSADDVTAAIKNGQSIADLAKSKNVDPKKVIDALTAKGDARIDKAVSDKRITAERGTALKNRLETAVTTRVNKTHAKAGG